jgi:DNA invertase Pin-like site-specific DNA recombinase
MKKRPRSKPKTCALYHRVSTRDQNPTAAARALKAHAKRLGFRVALYADEVGSSRDNLPARERVMDAARAGKVDAIIVWKLDRFGRSMIDLVTKLQELQALGVRFIASTQGIDLGADAGAAAHYYLHSLAAAAEFEREIISERTHLGLEHAVRRGRKLGRRANRLDLERVRELRGEKRTWQAIADDLGVGRETIRRALERDAKKLEQSIGVRGAAAHKKLRTFVERGAAAQAAVDELVAEVPANASEVIEKTPAGDASIANGAPS